MTARIWQTCHRLQPAAATATLAAALSLVWSDAQARGDLNGRAYLTYQDSRTGGDSQEYFLQHYEATLRDYLFENHRLAASIYFDDSKSLTFDQTFRRYRGQLHLSHRLYAFDARIAPRQKVTPLQLEQSREVVENQAALELRVPKAPLLRLSYSTRQRYDQQVYAGRIRDLRGDLIYRVSIFDFRLNRWYAKNDNGGSRETDVTGAGARVTKSWGPQLTVNGGYDYQINETTNPVGSRTDVTSHTVNALLATRYRDVVGGSFSLTSRQLTTEVFSELYSRVDTDNDNATLLVQLFPTSALSFDASRTYLSTKQNGSLIRTDYATLQGLLRGTIIPATTGRLQVAKRFDIDTRGGVVAPDIYYGAIRSRIYDGIDLRVDVNVSERNDPVSLIAPYQMTTVVDLFLKPRPSITISPHIQYLKTSTTISFLRNDRHVYGVLANYFPRSRMSLGLDLRRTRVTTVRPRDDFSVIANANAYFGQRSSFAVSYGLNDTQYPTDGGPSASLVGDRANTLTLQTTVWVVPKGSLSLNYARVDRDVGIDTSNLSVSFRLDV
jgi:hypothetical protein